MTKQDSRGKSDALEKVGKMPEFGKNLFLNLFKRKKPFN